MIQGMIKIMSRRFKSRIYLLMLVLLTIGMSCVSTNHVDDVNSFAEAAKYFPVTRVVDGDTFWVDNGSTAGLKIRLIGIDAPETRNSFKKTIGYYGKEATAYLTTMLAGHRVRLVSDVDSLDRFGRTLSYVYLEDGTFVNAELIKGGYAVLMTIPPNVRFADEFAVLQREARESGRGLWGAVRE